MLLIDYFAHHNKLAAMHPGEKFIFSLLTMGIGLALPSTFVSTAVILVAALAVILLAGVPVRVYLKLLLIPASFLTVGVLTVAFTFTRNGQDLLWSIQLAGLYAGVTPGGLETAGQLFLRSLGAVSCLYFLALTTPVTEVVAVLKGLRLPSLVIELMVLIYRYIFILLETAGQIFIAQSSRLGYRNLRTGYISLSRLVLALFIKSYRQSQAAYDALLSRCYDGRFNFITAKRRWSWSNLVLILTVDGIIAASRLFTGGYGG